MAQSQHKIPRVYLRQFGYRDGNNHWVIDVNAVGSAEVERKPIKSFSAETDIFNINSDDPKIKSLFEDVNGILETQYPKILEELANNALSEKSIAFLLQLIPNLIVRLDPWRIFVETILNSPNKDNFLKSVLAHRAKEEGQLGDIDNWHVFTTLKNMGVGDAINRVIMFFMEHLLERIQYYQIVIFESNPSMPWFTTDNPVVLHLKSRPFEVFSVKSEIYFPLSPRFLAYFYVANIEVEDSANDNPLKQYESNKVHQITPEQNEHLQHIILDNPSNYMIHAYIPPQ